jgi:hypothetical protein
MLSKIKKVNKTPTIRNVSGDISLKIPFTFAKISFSPFSGIVKKENKKENIK